MIYETFEIGNSFRRLNAILSDFSAPPSFGNNDDKSRLGYGVRLARDPEKGDGAPKLDGAHGGVHVLQWQKALKLKGPKSWHTSYKSMD